MTEEEYVALVAEYGGHAAEEFIRILDNYKGASGKAYKSDYRAILNWVVKRYDEEQRGNTGKNQANQANNSGTAKKSFSERIAERKERGELG